MPNRTRGLPDDRIIIIGENFNATRKIKATSPRVQEVDGATGIAYTDLDGTRRLLDCTDIIPEDPAERHSFMIPHVAQALRNKDLDYITYAIRAQERAGAHIIDLCVDEMSVYPEERYEWIGSLVETAQSITDSIVAIDSSDSKTIYAGLEAHDSSKSRPAINSFNLENGRQELVGIAKERDAILFANASGNTGMPQNADERVANLTRCMEMMDDGGVPPEDRFLDALVFPVGAGPEFGGHYLDAVRALREKYPGRAHLRRAQQRLVRTAEPQAPQPDVRHPLDPGRLRRRDDRSPDEPAGRLRRLQFRRQRPDRRRRVLREVPQVPARPAQAEPAEEVKARAATKMEEIPR